MIEIIKTNEEARTVELRDTETKETFLFGLTEEEWSDKENIALEKYNEMLYSREHPAPPTYQELRRAEYPPIQEQLDMQYWDSINGTNNWADLITAIKNKYPKN